MRSGRKVSVDIVNEVGDDFDDSVTVDIPAADGFDTATLIDVVDGPFGDLSFWVLTPSECLSPPATCDDVEPAVLINVEDGGGFVG